METVEMIDQLLYLLPYWHYKIERPLKQLQKNKKISFETYYCLRLLHDKKEMSMKELTAYLHISKQQMTKMVQILEYYKFIKRSPNKIDHRIYNIEITEIGSNYITSVNMNEEFLLLLQQKFSKEDIQKLQTAIHYLLEIMVKEKEA